MDDLGLAVRHLYYRKRAGLTQVQEAEAAGVSPTTISGIESGKITRPHLSTLLSIAEVLGISPEDLLKEDWERAVENARHFRESSRERMVQEITAWKCAKNDGKGEEERRQCLDEMGRILQEAYDAETELLANLEPGLNRMSPARARDPKAHFAPNTYWEEVRATARIYGELTGMVRGVGLSIKQAESTEVGEPRPEKVLEPA